MKRELQTDQCSIEFKLKCIEYHTGQIQWKKIPKEKEMMIMMMIMITEMENKHIKREKE